MVNFSGLKTKSSIFLLVVSVIGTIASLSLSSVFVREVRRERMDRWLARYGKAVPGTITDMRVVKKPIRTSRRTRGYQGVYRVGYEYEVDGAGRFSAERLVGEDAWADFSRGQSVSLRIDPDRPERSLLLPTGAEDEARAWVVGMATSVSVVLTLGGWCLAVLCATGRLSSGGLQSLFTRDLSGRRRQPGAE